VAGGIIGHGWGRSEFGFMIFGWLRGGIILGVKGEQ
jgi:hypothetical protein